MRGCYRAVSGLLPAPATVQRMLTPTVIEMPPALEMVCRDPFLDDPVQPSEPAAPAARRRTLTARRSRRALIDPRCPRRAEA
jgi:hypothetical protein